MSITSYRIKLFSILFGAIFILQVFQNSAQEMPSNKVLVVFGGKKIDTTTFLGMFDSLENTAYDTVSKPYLFNRIDAIIDSAYSTYVFYDSYGESTSREDSLFLKLAGSGTGMLFLHHSITSHQDCEEFQQIVGGRYHYNPWYDGSKKYGPSTYKHDQQFTVKIIDKSHPVTNGIQDFEIQDETYINMEVNDNVIPILSTDNRESVKYIGWINTYKNTKVVYLQPGHDKKAFQNVAFNRLVSSSIKWLQKD